MYRELTHADLDIILNSIDREEHFLYYSYLTLRKSGTVHFGQYSDQGELLGVLAYLKGLPFHAFSVFPIHRSFDLQSILSYMKEELDLPKDTVGSFIVNEEVMVDIVSQIEFVRPPSCLLLMKHIHMNALPPIDKSILHLGASHAACIESKMNELNPLAFTKEELNYPFFGVMSEQSLIAIGGYHIYSKEYVELGNIGTDVAWRRKGYGQKICAALTRSGRAVSPDVYLNVFENNVGAVHLYRSIGYEVLRKQYLVEFMIR